MVGTHTRPASSSPLVTGLVTAAVSAGLFGVTYAGRAPLAVAVLVLQVVFTLAWLAVLGVTGGTGAFAVAAGAAIAADAVVVGGTDSDIGGLVGVVGVAMVAALGHQLLRRHRTAVTRSLAGTMSAVLLVVATATYVALRAGTGGRAAAATSFAGVAAAMLLSRLVDLVLPRPAVVPEGGRGWAGLLVGALAAAGAGALYGWGTGTIDLADAWPLALVAGVTALAADLGVDACRAAYDAHDDDRARSALDPVDMLAPVAVAAPAAYVAARLLMG